MKIVVIVDTGEADQGYDEGEEPTFETHKDDIQELLRSGYYDIVSISNIEGFE
jgi:hypothetical protein